MNGTAARRSSVNQALNGGGPADFIAQHMPLADTQSKKPARGRTLVRGWPVQLAYAVTDIIVVCAIGVAMIWLRFFVILGPTVGPQLFDHRTEHAYQGFFLLYAMLIVLSCVGQYLYRTPRDRSVFEESLLVTRAVTIATLILVTFIFISGYKEISRPIVFSAAILNIVFLSYWRYLKRQLVLKRTAAGIGVSRVLIVGSGPMADTLGRLIDSKRLFGYELCGFLTDKPTSDPQVLGTPEQLRDLAIGNFADEIFVTLPAEREMVKQVALVAYTLRLGLKVFPDLYDGLGWKAPLATIGGLPVMDLDAKPIPTMGRAVKHIVDILVSGLGLIIASPLLAVFACWIRLDSPGPALYTAERVGLKAKKFRCYKLRTMENNGDLKKEELRATNQRHGPFFKIENDPRLTRVGRWLRKFSIDELPQLWNVLRGDMSLVGPRPHPVDDYEQYSLEHMRRLEVLPGITGLWQVTARRDPSFEKSMELDLEYIENWNLGLDFKILLKTLPAVFRAEGR